MSIGIRTGSIKRKPLCVFRTVALEEYTHLLTCERYAYAGEKESRWGHLYKIPFPFVGRVFSIALSNGMRRVF